MSPETQSGVRSYKLKQEIEIPDGSSEGINIPFRDVLSGSKNIYTLYGIFLQNHIDKEPVRVYYYCMNEIAKFIKSSRKAAGLTQKEFALRSGLGLRFVRDLEQGKETVRMDKVNQALAMFGMTAVPGKITGEDNGL